MPDTPVTKKDLEDLTEKIGALTAAFEATESFSEETREIAVQAEKATTDANRANRNILLVGLVALCLVGAFFYINDRADDAEDRADLNTAYLTAGCEAGNESRALEKSLWDTLFAQDIELSEAQGVEITAEEQAALDKVYEKVTEAYAQRDCAKVKEGEVVTVTPSPGSPTPTLTPATASKAKKTPRPAPTR